MMFIRFYRLVQVNTRAPACIPAGGYKQGRVMCEKKSVMDRTIIRPFSGDAGAMAEIILPDGTQIILFCRREKSRPSTFRLCGSPNCRCGVFSRPPCGRLGDAKLLPSPEFANNYEENMATELKRLRR